jgi:CheY-like chemotaxis protein
VTRRVLVVDDAAELRLLIRRMLSSRGYDVDLAETLAQARSLDPSGYDAVLIDAHLGPERGTDLVEWLRARDPAAAARCLIISGGAATPLPDGVTCLPKPFGMDDLLAAVRAIEAAAGTAPVRHSGPVPAMSAPPRPSPPLPSPPQAPPPQADPPQAPPPQADPPQAPPPQADPAWRLLGAVGRSRAAERRRLADFLHDGPIQELAAAVLELQLISQPGDAGIGAAGAVLRRLQAVTGSLRWLVDRGWPEQAQPGGLAAEIRQRTAELLAIPAMVEVSGRPEPADAAAVPGGPPPIADLVELMLTEIGAAGQPALAHVAVRLSADQTQVETSIGGLADALGAGATTEFSPGQWRARFTLRRDAA